MLTHAEYTVLNCAKKLAPNAYAVTIMQATPEALRTSYATLYARISSLVFRGLLTTHMSEVRPKRGGRRKQMLIVTPKGQEALADFVNTAGDCS